MKLRFALLTFLLLFSRTCDFYSTSLWFFQENGKKGEMNPLTKIFGAGWSGLLISNIILIGIIIYCLYYFYFRYKRPANLPIEPTNYKELASLQYYNSVDKFYQILYKIPKNKKVLLAHIGFVLAITTIIASFLATFHNLSQYYGFTFYNQFRKIVGRPLFVIYGLIVLTLILTYRQILKNEYSKYKTIRQRRA